MKLICPECSTSYAASPNALGETGRKVKCHKCAHVWFATPQEAFDAAEADAAVNSEQDDIVAPSTTNDEPQGDIDADAEIAAFEDIDDDAPPSDEDGLMTSDEAEADAAWDSVLEDSGFVEPANINDDDLQFVDASGGADADDSVDIETLAARRPGGAAFGAGGVGETGKRRRLKLPRMPSLSLSGTAGMAAALLLTVALTGAGLFQFRTQVVTALPGTAKLFAAIGYPVNLRGLELVNVTFAKGIENGLPVLAVSGEIVNITGAQQRIPELRFSLRNDSAQEIYHWTGRAEAGELGPSGRVRFLTRLASPPVAATEIQVRFTGKVQNKNGLRS